MAYRFADFRLDPAMRELRRGDEVVALPASAFDCMLYLLENRARAVGKDELIAAVWGRSDASDAVLAQTLVRVRRALGDTGSEQHTIQTVPRFGYRWLARIDEEIDEAAGADAAISVSAAAGADSAFIAAAPQASIRRRSWRIAAIGFATVAVVAVFVFQAWWPRAPDERRVVTTSQAAPAPISAALVMPAAVEAGEDWAWLRLGLMDLIANRLRRADIATTASESVVALLGETTGGVPVAVAADDARLATAAALRIAPRARFDGERWHVRLDTFGRDPIIVVEASATDILGAGRDAADRLLVALGHVPPAARETASGELEELLQRTRSAMLGNRFDEAQRLIDAAPAALRTHPEVELRRANIELRAGRYAQAQARLQHLLDGAGTDEWRATRGRALVTLAAIHVRRNEAALADIVYRDALTALEGSDDTVSLGLAHHGLGLVALVRGDVDGAAAHFGYARTDMARVGSVLGVAQVDMGLALSLAMRHRPADALAAWRAVELRLQRIGAREELLHAWASEIDALVELLDYAEALRVSDNFWPPDTHAVNARARWLLHIARARALLGVGRIAEATDVVGRVLAAADPQDDAIALAHAHGLAARLALLRGEAVEASRLAARAHVEVLRNGEDARWYARYGWLHVQALRAAGQTDAAVAVAEALVPRARGGSDEWMRALTAALSAEVAAMRGRDDEAFAGYAVALNAAEQVGTPLDTLAIVDPYLLALIGAGRLDEAKAVGGRIAAWSERDLLAATLQARLFAALGEAQAAQRARGIVAELSGGVAEASVR